MCAEGMCVLQQMCPLKLPRHPRWGLLLVSVLSPLECSQSGTGWLSSSGTNALEQLLTSCRWDLLERFLKCLSFYLGVELRHAFLSFPTFPNEIELLWLCIIIHLLHVPFWLSTHLHLLFLHTFSSSWDRLARWTSYFQPLFVHAFFGRPNRSHLPQHSKASWITVLYFSSVVVFVLSILAYSSPQRYKVMKPPFYEVKFFVC